MNTLLTKENIKVGLTIIDEEGREATIVYINREPRRYFPNDIRFTYKIKGGYYCGTSIGNNPNIYPKYII